MKLAFNQGVSHFIGLVFLFLLVTSGAPAGAAPTKAETRAWDLAREKFQDAKSLLVWSMVENDFAEFRKKYPESDYYAEAVVYQARALYAEHKFDEAIALLAAQSPRAGASADKFNYYTAMSWLGKTNDLQAAEAFARLTRENPASDFRPEALVREAQAHARLKYWPKVIEDLSEPDGAFQQLAATNSGSDLVVRGLLLLAQAQLIQSNYTAAEKTVTGIPAENPRTELAWERQRLICRIQLESGHPQAALASCSNLLAVAGVDADLKDQSLLLKGEILESLGRLPEAIQTYQLNVDSGISFERRRDALLRVVELMLQQGRISDAGAKLDDFWKKNPDAKGTDFELLVHGELQLKEALGAPGLPGDASLLAEAQADFSKLIAGFTNSPYLGKAQLNLGWCYLASGKTAESQAAFSNAVESLPVSAEQAVARFNLAQILFQERDYAGAVSNYSVLLDNPGYARLAGVTNELFEPALYQMVQAGLAQSNSALASDAMAKILKWFPDRAAAPRSMLLVGQARTAQAAREVLEDCAVRFPQSGLLPEVKLAIARTYAEEADWTNALARYVEWIAAYPDDRALPRAEFARAWMTYKSGDSTNAYLLFTNFVTRFKTNSADVDDLPAKAQFWVGDYFFNQGEFQKAELNYEEIFDKWPASPLALAARMMAGRSAMARQSPQEAKAYFTNLIANPACPDGLKQQAYFALADANVTPATYADAINLFRYIAKTYTNSPIAAQAWGRLGDCYYAIAPLEAAGATNAADAARSAIPAYTNAADAFQQAMQTTNAATRSEAEFRLAQTDAAIAQLSADGQKSDYLKQAFNKFLDVFHADGQEDGSGANLYLIKEAGLNAAKLAEDQGDWDQAIQLYQRLQLSLPQLRDNLEKKINSARENAQKK